MSGLNRRSFLAGTTALLATPALHVGNAASDVDTVIVGAGAAGVAAARRLVEGKARIALVEAGGRFGGRCITDSELLGVPFDLGAHWLHEPDSHPLVRLAPATGLEVYPAPRGLSMRVGPREARAGELESFLSHLVRTRRALHEPARDRTDIADRALSPDLGVWRSTIAFMLGPYFCGKPLDKISAEDLRRAGERDIAAFCRQGCGTLLAKLAAGLPARFFAPVTLLTHDRSGVDVHFRGGRLRARTAIVTISTGALTEGMLEFKPALPRGHLQAAAALSLGSYDHIGLLMPGNPLGLQRDDLVLEQASGPRTAALLANISGTALHTVSVAGDFGRELASLGEATMIEFAREWLLSLFGSGVGSRIVKTHATRWNGQPFMRGAMSAATPGHADARRILQTPVGGRIWFAGEATHETRWGTVAGAWESGERAALAALGQMGMLDKPKPEQAAPHGPSRRRRRR